jgi:hypothetical protein
VSQGDYEAAQSSLEEGLQVARELGDQVGMAYALEGLGKLACINDDPGAARRYLEESVKLRHAAADREGLNDGLQALAQVTLTEGHADTAVRLLAAIHVQRQAIGVALLAADQSTFDQIVANAKDRLPPAAFDAAWADGEALTIDQLIELAFKP